MNIIKECLRHASTVDEAELATAPERILAVDAALHKANEQRKKLYGIERHAFAPLAERIRELTRERNRLEQLSKVGNLPCLSFEVLKWRNDKGWPRVALIGLHSPKVQFGVIGRITYSGRHWSPRFEPKLPLALQSCYKDVVGKLAARAKERRQSVYIAAEYTGIIPDTTREKIGAAQKQFDEVFVLAGVQHWQLSFKAIPKPRPRYVDPLVVGFDGSCLWIIDHFNLTPVERYIRNEFCV